MKNNNYVIKSIRLHKKYDSDIINAIQEFSKRRKLSDKIKDVLREYFFNQKKNEEILYIIKEINNKINNNSFSTNSNNVSIVDSTIKKVEKSISINDLMNDLKNSETQEELF